MRTTSKKGIELIKSCEGFSPSAYWDNGAFSVGYGHRGVSAGTMVTRDEAEHMLAEDLLTFEDTVNKVNPKLSQGQFDAAVSLAYNIGTTRFSKSNVAALMAADPTPTETLEREWKEWRLANGTVNHGLMKRRTQEWDMYVKASNSNKLFGIAAVAVLAAAGGLILMN